MLIYMQQHFKQVTSDQWADHCSNFPCYGTEKNIIEKEKPALVMVSSNSNLRPWQRSLPIGTIVGIVTYENGETKHWIP